MSEENKKISCWILNSKGGVGKTTLAMALVDLMELSNRPMNLLEVDSRKRLSSFMGEENVMSFNGAPLITEIRSNPNLILNHYDPIVEAFEEGDTLLDLGANEDAPFIEYCKLSRVDEDLIDMNVQVIAFVPTVAESESIKGALEALDKIKEHVPSAIRVMVLNEREQGSFEKLLPNKELKKLAADGVQVMEMPRILSEGWEDFQRMKMRYLEIISMSPAEIQEKLECGRSKAKRSRGDIAFWFESMRRSLVNYLPIIDDL